MKTMYYLLRHKGFSNIYMVSELETPPKMDFSVLDTWLVGRHGEILLPYGCSGLQVSSRSVGDLPLINMDSVEVIDTYVESEIPKPSWLEDFRVRESEKIERHLRIGSPTLYEHLVPVYTHQLPSVEKKKEEFVSVDPLTNPVFYDTWMGKKDRVLVTGCFDLFHAGHLHFLREVYEKYVRPDRELYIGLADDLSVFQLKGRKPLYAFKERKDILEALPCVTKVHGFSVWVDVPHGTKGVEDGHRYLLKEVKPVLFVDSKQKPKERIGIMPYLEEAKIPIQYVNSIDIHTTEIIKRIQGYPPANRYVEEISRGTGLMGV